MASVKSEQSAAAKAGAVKDEAYNGPKPKFQPNIAHSSPWGTTLGAQLDDSDFHVERKPGQKQPTPSPVRIPPRRRLRGCEEASH